MPALIPQSVLKRADTPDIQECVANGWDLQIRGRVHEHIEYFLDTYMDDLPHSRIYASPDKDYTVRAYTSKENYAEGMKRYLLAMDYEKFKETSNRFPWGKKYHDLLVRIWSASTSLNPAGGFYGPKSKDNPRGYEPARKYKRGNPRKARKGTTSTLWDDLHGPYSAGGVDDLPTSLTTGEHRRKSIHDLTNAELEEMWFNG